MRESVRRYFDRKILSDLVVLWFAVWILWWFRRWLGHSATSFPDPASPGARAYYAMEMRTLGRSVLQSFIIASVALGAWRIFRNRAPKTGKRSS